MVVKLAWALVVKVIIYIYIFGFLRKDIHVCTRQQAETQRHISLVHFSVFVRFCFSPAPNLGSGQLTAWAKWWS